MNRLLKHLLLLFVFIALFQPAPVEACATCFGKSDAAMAQGMNFGILSLMLVIGMVLTGIATFFVFIARRSAKSTADYSLNELK